MIRRFLTWRDRDGLRQSGRAGLTSAMALAMLTLLGIVLAIQILGDTG